MEENNVSIDEHVFRFLMSSANLKALDGPKLKCVAQH